MSVQLLTYSCLARKPCISSALSADALERLQAAAAAVTALERTFPDRAGDPVLEKIREGILAHVRSRASRRRRREWEGTGRGGGGRDSDRAQAVGAATDEDVPPPPPPHPDDAPSTSEARPDGQAGAAASGAASSEHEAGLQGMGDRCERCAGA